MKTKDFSGIRNNGPLPSPTDLAIPDDVEDMLDDYFDSACSMLDELEQAALAYEGGRARDENAATIRRVLHKIKGESSMMGIDDVSELCHQAEFAFDELPDVQRPDMLLRFKDWLSAAMHNSTN